MEQESIFQIHYVYDSCEPNVNWTYGRAEPWSILTSFAFLIAWILGYSFVNRRIAENTGSPYASFARKSGMTKRAEEYSKSCLNTLAIVSILSAIHHSNLTWQSQLVDEIGVLQAQVAYFQQIQLLSMKQWISLVLFVLMGVVHPLFPGVMIFYLFYSIGRELLELSKEFPQIRGNAIFVLSLNVIALLSGVLDYFLCPFSHYLILHSVAHVCLALYCLFGALLCYDLKILMNK